MTAHPAARRPRPHGRVRDPPRHRARGEHVDISDRQGRDGRHRRRVRLRQVGHVLRGDAHPRPRRPDRRGLGACSPASTCAAPAKSEMRDLRGREISMIFQNPRAALNPIRKVGHQIEDVLLAACRRPAPRQVTREGDRDPRPGAHRAPARALPRLSVRAVRRHVPARRDRAGARLPAAAPDRRRADHRPRRHHAEDGDGPDRRADARARHVDHPDHPRPRPRRRLLRPRRGDGEGPRGRDRAVARRSSRRRRTPTPAS